MTYTDNVKGEQHPDSIQVRNLWISKVACHLVANYKDVGTAIFLSSGTMLSDFYVQ